MTSRKIAATLLLALQLVAAATSAMAGQTFITTNWIDTKLSMDECLSRAADAIRGAGGWGKVLNTPTPAMGCAACTQRSFAASPKRRY